MFGKCMRNRDALRLSEISVDHIIVNYVGASSEDIVTVLSDDGRRIIKSLVATVYDLINREQTSSLMLDKMIYDSYEVQLEGNIKSLKKLSEDAKTAELDGLTRRLVTVIEGLCGNQIPLGVQHLLGKMRGVCSFRDYGVLLISHPAIVDRAEFQGIVNRLYFNLKYKGRIKYLVGCMPNDSYPTDWSGKAKSMSDANQSFQVFRQVCKVSVSLKGEKDKGGEKDKEGEIDKEGEKEGRQGFYLTKFGLLTFLRELYAHGGDKGEYLPETLCLLVYYGVQVLCPTFIPELIFTMNSKRYFQHLLYHGHGRIIRSTPRPMSSTDLVPGYTPPKAKRKCGNTRR